MTTEQGRNPIIGRAVLQERAGWVLAAMVLGLVVVMIGVGMARVGSDQGTAPGFTKPSPPPPTVIPAVSSSVPRVINLRTGERTRLPREITGTTGACCYSISPDGGRVAFLGIVGTSDDPWVRGIFVAGVGGENVLALPTQSGARANWAPQWSPDGTSLVYERSDGAIVVVDVASGRTTQLTDGRLSGRIQPTYSPDGRTILFTGEHRQPAALWTIPSAGGRESLVLEPAAYATYSPDGTTIAYTSVGTKPVVNSYRGIWLADADGRHPRPISKGQGVAMGFLVGLQPESRAAWSPDGTRIAASLFEGKPVVVYDLRTGESQEVAGGGIPVWLDNDRLLIDEYEPRRRRAKGA